MNICINFNLSIFKAIEFNAKNLTRHVVITAVARSSLKAVLTVSSVEKDKFFSPNLNTPLDFLCLYVFYFSINIILGNKVIEDPAWSISRKAFQGIVEPARPIPILIVCSKAFRVPWKFF
jgi:hypothetical protein